MNNIKQQLRTLIEELQLPMSSEEVDAKLKEITDEEAQELVKIYREVRDFELNTQIQAKQADPAGYRKTMEDYNAKMTKAEEEYNEALEESDKQLDEELTKIEADTNQKITDVTTDYVTKADDLTKKTEDLQKTVDEALKPQENASMHQEEKKESN